MKRIENHHGHDIVCGHFYLMSELKVGQKWQSSCGSIVEITNISPAWITYTQVGGTEGMASSFAFQHRYCLILSTTQIKENHG